MPDTNAEIAEYQSLLRREKEALLITPEGREAALDLLMELQKPSKQRRISAMTLARLVFKIDCGIGTAAEFVDELSALKLNVEQWNGMRMAVEKSSGDARNQWMKALETMANKRNELIVQHMHIVPRVRRQVAPDRADNAEDLDGYGVLGLIRALDLFDASFGKSFVNYARIWISASIMGFIRKDHTVYNTDNASRTLSRFRKAILKLGRQADDVEIAEHLGISEQQMAEIENMKVSVSSFDEPLDDKDIESSLHQIIALEVGVDLAEIDAKGIQERIDAMLESMDPQERTVLRLSLGCGRSTTAGATPRAPTVAVKLLVDARIAKLKRALSEG